MNLSEIGTPLKHVVPIFVDSTKLDNRHALMGCLVDKRNQLRVVNPRNARESGPVIRSCFKSSIDVTQLRLLREPVVMLL